MKSAAVWLVVLIVGLTLLVSGVQGTFGLVLATIFVPGDLIVDTGTASPGTPGGGGGTTNPNCSQPNNQDCSCPGMAGSPCSDLWGFMPGICIDGKCIPVA